MQVLLILGLRVPENLGFEFFGHNVVDNRFFTKFTWVSAAWEVRLVWFFWATINVLGEDQARSILELVASRREVLKQCRYRAANRHWQRRFAVVEKACRATTNAANTRNNRRRKRLLQQIAGTCRSNACSWYSAQQVSAWRLAATVAGAPVTSGTRTSRWSLHP